MAEVMLVIDQTTGDPRPVRSSDFGGGGGGGSTSDGNPGTGTQSTVNSANTSTTLLAANTARYGFTIVNTDANALKVLLGSGTASATNYTFEISPGVSRSVTGYSGIVKGIWDADGSGAAIITEIS